MSDSSESKRSPKSALQFLLGLLAIVLVVAVFGGLLYGIWALFGFWFSHLQKEVSAAIVGAFATVTVAALAVVGGRLLERRSISQKAQQEKRVPIYEEFVRDLFESIGKFNASEVSADSTEAIQVFNSFATRSVIWGSGEVLKKWIELRAHYKPGAVSAVTKQEYDLQGLIKLENLLVALRKDLGLSTFSHKPGDVLGAIITDLDRYLGR
jgi:hypothetical protein